MGGTNPVATYVAPINTTQDATTYKGNIDAAFAVGQRVFDNFAPHQTATPAMTVSLDAGHIFNGTTLTEVAAQTTGTITAPVSHDRIDRVVVDNVTGAVSVITGVENVSPTAPAITSGKSPVAQVLLHTSTTTITNSLITDERDFSAVAASSSSASGGFVNKFRNATFDTWQHGTSGTITAGSPAYTADGWIVNSTGANVPWAQTAGRASTLWALKVTGATSVTDVLVKQRIESYLAAPLYPNATAQVTVQAKIYNNTGGSITPTLTVKHANAADNWGATTTDVNAVSLQACPNATLTTVAYTFASASGTQNGLEVTIDFGNNFSTSGKSVEVAEWDIRVTPGVSTGLNSSPPTPELRPISSEMALNQRYFASTFGNGVTPAQNAGKAGCLTAKAMNNSGDFDRYWQFPVPMRTASPTITTYNPSANNANWRDFTGSADLTVQVDPQTTLGSTGVYINVTGAPFTAQHVCGIHASASAEL